jgi:hypothetical protein
MGCGKLVESVNQGGVFFCDLCGPIRAAIIYQDEFKLAITLGLNALDAFRQIFSRIVEWRNNTY